MSNIDIDSGLPRGLGGAIGRLRHQWGYFLAHGILTALLGTLALALVVSATIASVVLLGAFVVLSGLIEIGIGFRSRSWGRFFLWVLAGLLYLVAGAVAIAQPLLAAAFFTLVLGAGLLATGLIRLWIAYEMPPGSSRGVAFLSGAVTTALGLLIVTGWPADSLYLLGLMLGVDLIFYGWSWIGFALLLRGRTTTP